MSIASIITRYWSLELCKELKKWKKKWKGAEERHHCKYQRKATAQRNAALKKKVTSMSRALHSSPLYSHVRVVSGCPFWKLPIDLDTNVVSSYFKINVPFGLGKCAITYWFQGYNKNLEMDRYWIFLSVVCAPPSSPSKRKLSFKWFMKWGQSGEIGPS